MKNIIKKIKNKFIRKTSIICNDNNNESPQNDSGDLVPLIWMIEKLRRKKGGCTMNELIAKAKHNFKNIEQIKHRTINYNQLPIKSNINIEDNNLNILNN